MHFEYYFGRCCETNDFVLPVLAQSAIKTRFVLPLVPYTKIHYYQRAFSAYTRLYNIHTSTFVDITVMLKKGSSSKNETCGEMDYFFFREAERLRKIPNGSDRKFVEGFVRRYIIKIIIIIMYRNNSCADVTEEATSTKHRLQLYTGRTSLFFPPLHVYCQQTFHNFTSASLVFLISHIFVTFLLL